jgi:hypothetical protein
MSLRTECPLVSFWRESESTFSFPLKKRCFHGKLIILFFAGELFGTKFPRAPSKTPSLRTRCPLVSFGESLRVPFLFH